MPSVASPLWHGRASGPKFAQMAQPYRGDTVEGNVDLCDRGITQNICKKYDKDVHVPLKTTYTMTLSV